jgi:hypothetical protein
MYSNDFLTRIASADGYQQTPKQPKADASKSDQLSRIFPRTKPIPPTAPLCPEQSHHPNPQLGGRGPALHQRALIEILAHSHDALLQVRGPKALHVVRLDPSSPIWLWATGPRPGVNRVPREAAGSDEATQSLRGAGAVVGEYPGTRAWRCRKGLLLGLTAGCDHRRFCILSVRW